MGLFQRLFGDKKKPDVFPEVAVVNLPLPEPKKNRHSVGKFIALDKIGEVSQAMPKRKAQIWQGMVGEEPRFMSFIEPGSENQKWLIDRLGGEEVLGDFAWEQAQSKSLWPAGGSKFACLAFRFGFDPQYMLGCRWHSDERQELWESRSPSSEEKFICKLWKLPAEIRLADAFAARSWKDENGKSLLADIPGILPVASEGFARMVGPFSMLRYKYPKVIYVVLAVPGPVLPMRLLLPETRFNVDQAITLLYQIGKTLFMLHSGGWVHGQLSPHSLWVGANENGATVAYLDGSTMFRPQADTATTLGSMAIATGLPGEDLSALSDQWMLGAVVYQLLTGRMVWDPWAGRKPKATLPKIRPVHQVIAGIPRWLSSVLARMMAVTPTDRFENLQAMVQALSSRQEEAKFLEEAVPANEPEDIISTSSKTTAEFKSDEKKTTAPTKASKESKKVALAPKPPVADQELATPDEFEDMVAATQSQPLTVKPSPEASPDQEIAASVAAEATPAPNDPTQALDSPVSNTEPASSLDNTAASSESFPDIQNTEDDEVVATQTLHRKPMEDQEMSATQTMPMQPPSPKSQPPGDDADDSHFEDLEEFEEEEFLSESCSQDQVILGDPLISPPLHKQDGPEVAEADFEEIASSQDHQTMHRYLVCPPYQPFRLRPHKKFTIGRDQGNDLILPSEDISRCHASITSEGEQYVICDQESANGTFVNSEKITRHELVSGDKISIGTTKMFYQEVQQGRAPDEMSKNMIRKQTVALPRVSRKELETSTFTGDIAHISIWQVLQMLAGDEKSGCLTIQNGQEVKIFFVNGVVVHCQSGAEKGHEVFYKLLSNQKGRFAFDPTLAPEEVSMSDVVESLLLEGARRIDEQRRLQEEN